MKILVYEQSTVHEFFELPEHVLRLDGVILEIFSRIYYQDVLFRVAFEPLLMFIMNQFQVVQRNLTLLGAFPNLCTLMTLLRGAPQIDNFGFIYGCHCFKAAV